MTTKREEGDPMSGLKYNTESSLPTRPPWLPAAQEVEILERVEDQLLQVFRAQKSAETGDVAGMPWGLRWKALWGSAWAWAGTTALAGAAALMLLLSTNDNSLPPLQTDGVAKLPAAQSGSTSSAGSIRMQAASDKQGHVSEAKRWDMQVGANAALAIERVGRHRRTVVLEHGFVQVHVTPGQVKQFAVHAQGYQVLVKGTVFTVERESGWLRVEVLRGKVTLRAPKTQREQSIAKGEGVRVELASGALSLYALPTPEVLDAHGKRLQWLYGKSQEDAYQYTLDLASSRRLSRAARLKQLKWLRDAFESKGDIARYVALQLEVARLHRHADAETTLLDALQRCLDHRLDKAICRKPLGEYLRRFPKGNPDLAQLRDKYLQRARQRGLITRPQ